MYTKKLLVTAVSAKVICIANLSGYKILFNKISSDGSAKCNLSKSSRDSDVVWGVVFKIDETDHEALRRSEGGYMEYSVILSDGNPAVTFIANPERVDDQNSPFDWYKEYCQKGAREHHLPANYIHDSIDMTPTKPDSDLDRSKKHRSMLMSSLS